MRRYQERLESHVDALVVSGDEALEQCRRQAKEGDPGELHAAVRLFCRQQRRDLLAEVLEQLGPDDKERWKAVVEALKHELPCAWDEDFVALLDVDDPQLASAVAEVAAFRRLDTGDYLIRALKRFQSPELLWAAGRLRERRAIGPLLGALLNPDDALSSVAALSLLRLGDRQGMRYCQDIAKDERWALLPLALGGGRSAGALVMEIAGSSEASPDALLSLGIVGDISAAPVLLGRLDSDLAASAALALNLLTGAELHERVFIPDEVDEDELFPEELEAYRKEGKVPSKADGSPFGEWVSRLSQKPEEWQRWWDQHGDAFRPGLRYRCGKPFTPAVLVESLQHERTPHRIRQLAYEELVIRYCAEVSFEADFTVDDQLPLLQSMAAWVKASGARFLPGEWYFAGEVIGSDGEGASRGADFSYLTC